MTCRNETAIVRTDTAPEWNIAMNLFWIVSGSLTVTALVTILLSANRHQWMPASQTARAFWLMAAMSTGALLIFIGATVSDLIPDNTMVDDGALAVTGNLTGFLLVHGPWPNDSKHAD